MKKREFFLVFSLFGLFIFLRLFHLTIIPIFMDEAIYLRWAQIAKNDASWRFISLTDGKQPLFIWLAMVAMKVIADPLVAGRIVSLGAGFLSFLGLGFLSFLLFGRQSAFWALLLYLFSPLYLLYNRLALVDSLLACFGIWSLSLGILLVRHLRLDIALLLGSVLGAAFLTKSPSVFYLYLLPLTLLLFNFKRKRKKDLFIWLVLFLIAYLQSQIYLNIMRLCPWFHMIKLKDANFIRSFSQVKNDPFRFFWGNFKALAHWTVGYLTWPLAVLSLVSFAFGIFREPEKTLLLSAYFLVPIFSMSLFGQVIYARYLVYCFFPLLALLSYLLSKTVGVFKNRALCFVFSLLLLLPSLWADFCLLTNPPNAPIPQNDKGQYIDDWPSGYGIKEIVSFLEEKSKEKMITVATEGTFGLLPYGLELYLSQNQNVEILAFWPVKEVPPQILIKARQQPTYFVFNETQKIPPYWPLRLIAAYPKGNKKVFMQLFEVIPD